MPGTGAGVWCAHCHRPVQQPTVSIYGKKPLEVFSERGGEKNGVHYGSSIEPIPDYRLFAEAYGGFGVRVDKPEDIRPSIDQALVHLREGRLALIDVCLSDYTPR